MYLALYRKYRPQTFDEVIGQDHIVRTLINQIMGDKIGHAYLFCGSRGTGKTSTAKIFAKAISCKNPKNGSPCGECDACKALSSNNIDILEIDAASNNGVDEIRDLREKVKYPPVNGRYKVYIVDEVHMLSPSAFNALLKTLEEPPSHAVFILATTEVHKLPATILSRCLRFDFNLVSIKDLSLLLERVFKKEGIKAEEDAIKVIARAGEGSVRDTLSIADRCVSYSGENLTYKSVMEVLGTTEKDKLITVASAVLSGNMGESMKRLDDILSSGKTPLVLSKDLIGYFRDLLIINTLKDEAKVMVVASEETFSSMKQQATDQNYSKIVSLISSLSSVEQELRYSTAPRIVLETAIIKSISDVNLLERVEALEAAISGGAISKQQNPLPPQTQKTVNASAVKMETTYKMGASSNILGELLGYLRDRKDMGLLAAVRQVEEVKCEGKKAQFFVDDELTLDLIKRDKYRAELNEFFESRGLDYEFLKRQNKASGDINELAMALNGKLEVDE